MSKSIVANCPECNEEFLFKTKAKRPRPHCPKCSHWFYAKNTNTQNTQSSQIKGVQGHKEVSSHTSTIDFIDDPNELLMSVAIRELNRPNPDSRWASILIQCKKEKITSKNEVLDQFKQLSTQALVNLLSKSLQAE